MAEAGLKSFTRMSPLLITPIWLLVTGCSTGLLVFLGHKFGKNLSQQSNQVGVGASTLATVPNQFNPDEFFAANYTSPLVDESINNIRAIGMTRYQTDSDRQEFYVRLIGVGLMAYFYDTIWWAIFKSQLLLLQELNQKMLSLDQARSFYETVFVENPGEYPATFTFDVWLQFVRNNQLIMQEGSQLGITMRGRDFLKFLIHWGRSPNQRRL